MKQHQIRYLPDTGIKSALTWLLLMVTGVLLLTSCKKNSVAGTGRTEDSILVLNFNQTTIAKDLIDSAVAFVKRESSQTPYMLRFHDDGPGLRISIDGMRSGEYTADIYLPTAGANTIGR
jgi:hypothetical protein